MADMQTLGVCTFVATLIIKRRRKRQRNRSFWVREWTQNQEERGAYHQLLQELRLNDTTSHHNFLRMDAATFDELLQKVGPLIAHRDTILRKAIPPSERLALTLVHSNG